MDIAKFEKIPNLIIKSVIAIVIIVGIVILARWAIKKYADTKSSKKDVKDVSKDINYGNLSYNSAFYYNLASQLYECMDGWFTQDSSVLELLYNLKNRDDYYMLINVFGVKNAEDLPAWLQKELSSKGLELINLYFKQKGII